MAPALTAIARRLDEPLRVALAGRVNAGKSTLLNALVGDELAPTDAGECTRVVTWYQYGATYRVTVIPVGAEPNPVAFDRDAGALRFDLGGRDPTEIERVEVEWPAPALAEMTVVDTPGLGSVSAPIAQRAWSFLAPSDDRVVEVDAVIYLLRHLHAGDIDFLEAFRDATSVGSTPINALGVLSRADEVAGGRIDALDTAARIAAGMSVEPRLTRACQQVVAVAGLLAQAGCTLRQDEYGSLAALAAAPSEECDRLLLSADRFVSQPTSSGVTPDARARLLRRLGVFGVRMAIGLLRTGAAPSAGRLAEVLTQESGLPQLRSIVFSAFAARAEVLKARSALIRLGEILGRLDAASRDPLLGELERIVATAHEFAELEALVALRQGAVPLSKGECGEAERLLGGSGLSAGERLGLLDPQADPSDVRAAALATLAGWRRRAEQPLASAMVVDVSRVVVRSCEGLLAELSGG